MKKVLRFFAGLMIVLIMIGAIVVAATIYGTGANTTVAPYFFQPDDMPIRRPGAPESPEEIDNMFPEANVMRNKLIQKYITEFFYVMPDMDDFQRRQGGHSALMGMSATAARTKWLEIVAPKIEEMIKNNQMRTVDVIDIISSDRFLRVHYQLKTWMVPNDMASEPEISYGTIYLNLLYKPGLRTTIQGQPIEDFLENGGNPAAAFNFIVYDVTIPENQTGK